jgi:hypothetical protein
MFRLIGEFLGISLLSFFSLVSVSAFPQKNYVKNPHVVYKVEKDSEYYTIHYTFKGHYNNLQNYTLKLPTGFTDSEIDVFGIPQWIFEPYADNEYNRMLRTKEIKTGLFKINDNVIEIDKSAVVERYAETFCKPVAGLIVQSLEEYGRDTRRDRIEMAIRFVQDIPYGIPVYADNKRHFGGVSPPPGILRNGYGDCDSKALLFAGIIIYLIPADDFVFLNQPEHVLSAVKEIPAEEQTFIKFNNQEYLIAETAGPGKRLLGEKGQYYRDKFKVEPLTIPTTEPIPFRTAVSESLPFADEHLIEKNKLVIQNLSSRDFRFQLSPDNAHWKEFSLHENTLGNYKFERETTVYLKIREKNTAPLNYKVQTGNFYRFSYNVKEKLWETAQ